MTDGAPAEVETLAQRRAAARAERDFAAADALRAAIADRGWVVRDSPDGYQLTPRPPYDVHRSLADLPNRSEELDTRGASLAVLAEGFPDDLRSCVEAALAHSPSDVGVALLEGGGAEGPLLHELVAAAPDRVQEWHVEPPLAHWAAARIALARPDTAAIHVWLDPSTVLTGDAITPLLAAFADPTVAAAGWRGVNVAADWRSFEPARPGDVDALNGYLLAVRRSVLVALGGGPHPNSRYYRNADLEMGFAIRAADLGRVVMTEELPVRQGRHHGYHDTPAAVRERESKRNYDRFLARFRGREELRARA